MMDDVRPDPVQVEISAFRCQHHRQTRILIAAMWGLLAGLRRGHGSRFRLDPVETGAWDGQHHPATRLHTPAAAWRPRLRFGTAEQSRGRLSTP
jgi:hypothetical protein